MVAPGSLADRVQPVLEADGLLLRPFTAEDAGLIVAGFRDPAVVRWHLRTIDDEAEALGWIDDVTARWSEEEAANWVIVDGGRPVGRVGLTRIVLAEGRGEIAYWVLASERGKHLAARAARAVAAWAFDDLGLHRLDLRHSTENEASCRVAAAAGFAVEGTARSALRHEDGWHDMHLHSRIAGDA